ncbi:hypothetical protein QQG55_54320 [Brugia pahangi]|uniref:Uncharacterized protein n=1 Tax=Brugia pahangi TaxID=6280 RepID=A0A0N4T637_BRUPA|nr:unnamed protein product [Brugia pahangi]
MKRFLRCVIFEMLITLLLIDDSVANESKQNEEIKIRAKRQFLSYGSFGGFSAFPFFNMGWGYGEGISRWESPWMWQSVWSYSPPWGCVFCW